MAPSDDVQEPQAALDRLLERYRPAIFEALRSTVESRSAPPFDLVPYHLGWSDRDGRPAEAQGGKLLRPVLCLLACDAVGGGWRGALPAAVALELLHNFTLIHDDVEDASDERHGRETLWRVAGQAQAINVGDGLFALAHATMLSLDAPADRVLAAARMLDDATLALCEGQQLDIASADQQRDRAAYLAMVDGKSCALLAASTGIGALLGGAPDATVEALQEYGRRLGFAFQIRDDILGVWGEPTVTGKSSSDDLRAGKRTFPVVVALEHTESRDDLLSLIDREEPSEAEIERARTLIEATGARDQSERAAAEHADRAVEALDGLPLDADRRGELAQLARFAADRRV